MIYRQSAIDLDSVFTVNKPKIVTTRNVKMTSNAFVINEVKLRSEKILHHKSFCVVNKELYVQQKLISLLRKL